MHVVEEEEVEPEHSVTISNCTAERTSDGFWAVKAAVRQVPRLQGRCRRHFHFHFHYRPSSGSWRSDGKLHFLQPAEKIF